MTTEFNYNDFVVVAHDEWKLECPKADATTRISAYLGGFEWRVAFLQQNYLSVECEELKKQLLFSDQFQLELFVYGRKNEGEDYKLATSRVPSPNPSRTLFKQGNHRFAYTFRGQYEFVAVNVRILKDRTLFHNFTVDRPVGYLQNDLKLKVGDQIFHVNKTFLEAVSLYFSRMFNNAEFVEAKQDTVELGESDAALFHDFLQNIIPIPSIKYKMRPDSQNLVGLMRLAQYYGVDSLFEKLEHSLKLFREIPITERILLARKYGGKEFSVASLLNEVVNVENWKGITMALFKGD